MADEEEETIPSKILINTFSPKAGSKVTLLGYDKNLDWEKIGNSILISIPDDVQLDPPCKFAWAFKINEIENSNFK